MPIDIVAGTRVAVDAGIAIRIRLHVQNPSSVENIAANFWLESQIKFALRIPKVLYIQNAKSDH